MTATGTARFATSLLPPDDAQAARPPGGAGAAPFTRWPPPSCGGAPLASRLAKLLYVVLCSYADPGGHLLPRVRHPAGGRRLRGQPADQGGPRAGGGGARPPAPAGPGQPHPLHRPRARGRRRPRSPQTPPWSEIEFRRWLNTRSTPSGEQNKDSGDQDLSRTASRRRPRPNAGDPPPAPGDDDALLAALRSYGVTPRIARHLLTTHGAQAVREQLAWHPHRPPATNPAGALVQAIRERWPAPPAWRAAQERGRRGGPAGRGGAPARRGGGAPAGGSGQLKPPEERIAGRLQFWVLGRRAKRHEPTGGGDRRPPGGAAGRAGRRRRRILRGRSETCDGDRHGPPDRAAARRPTASRWPTTTAWLEAGILREDDRVELLDGQVVD